LSHFEIGGDKRIYQHLSAEARTPRFGRKQLASSGTRWNTSTGGSAHIKIRV
jgi:hypothetical protein